MDDDFIRRVNASMLIYMRMQINFRMLNFG
jgi:hypothetical protein